MNQVNWQQVSHIKLKMICGFHRVQFIKSLKDSEALRRRCIKNRHHSVVDVSAWAEEHLQIQGEGPSGTHHTV